ncbi:MAG: hypothetical protein ACRC6V_01925 [Bacteroidales bacterium]
MSEEVRYRFIPDGYCHWYLIPVGLEALFYSLLENNEDDYAEFSNRCEEYRCYSPSNFTFKKPE